MKPFERFKVYNTQGNLWIYVISLGKNQEVCDGEARRMIFEKFGFLAGEMLLKSVLYRLRRDGYIKTEKFKGKKAYKATSEGIAELEKMKGFIQELLQKA